MASFSCFRLKVVQFYISVKCSNIFVDLSKKLSFSSFIYFYPLDGPNTRNLGETGQSSPYPSKGSNIMDDKKKLCYLTAQDNILACNLKCLFIKVFIVYSSEEKTFLFPEELISLSFSSISNICISEIQYFWNLIDKNHFSDAIWQFVYEIDET